MKIAILGTRGIPNHYGGFEQFAEYLSQGLVKRGFDITVYNSHSHPYQEKVWNGVNIIHCTDPENTIGTVGQFIYDLNCIIDSRTRNYDVILMLGYTSSSIWGRFLPHKQTIITTNMDGFEWQRSKYSKKVQRFLKYAESLGVKFSHHLIADSICIQDYLRNKYNREATYIPYGAHTFDTPEIEVLNDYGLESYSYNMLIARLEPENSIEIILDGVAASTQKDKFLVVGRYNTKYGEMIRQKYSQHNHIIFLGGIYDINILNNLRYFSKIYFHGHTVGGTNPSLLEAMGSNALICAHDNAFNKSILGNDAYYFKNAQDVSNVLESVTKKAKSAMNMLSNNTYKIKEIYNWDRIIDDYAAHFNQICKVNLSYSLQKATI